jgi:hypothetical protein
MISKLIHVCMGSPGRPCGRWWAELAEIDEGSGAKRTITRRPVVEGEWYDTNPGALQGLLGWGWIETHGLCPRCEAETKDRMEREIAACLTEKRD